MNAETAELEMWPRVNEAKLLTLHGNVQLDTRDAKTAALRSLKDQRTAIGF